MGIIGIIASLILIRNIIKTKQGLPVKAQIFFIVGTQLLLLILTLNSIGVIQLF